MKDLKFGVKLGLAFSVIFLLIIANTFWIIINLNDLVEDGDNIIYGTNLKQELKDAYIAHLEWADKVQEVLYDDKISKISVETDNHLCDFGKWYYGDEKEKIIKLIPDVESLLEQIETPHEKLHKSVIEINKLLKSDDTLKTQNIKELYYSTTKVNLDEVVDLLEKISKKSDNYIITSEHMQEQQIELKNITITIAILILILSIIMAYFITKTITKSLNEGIKFANQIAEGDLTAKIELNQKDEVGQLATALRKMIINLSETLSSIQTSANQITTASFEMSNNSQSISQGASEQASSTEEVSSSMQQMAANINQNTENAQQTEKISQLAAQQIEKGSTVVNETVQAMKKISERIVLIREIAQQTDLLAINAAVEAARAGEHGKGFAVVAGEVRKLAEKSQKAAKEIDELTKSSVEVADEAGKLLEEIVPQILKTANLVQEIAAASMEQEAGASQVNNAIQQLNQVTQQNAAASEEMATAAEELASQADHLLEIISQFKTNHKKTKDNSNFGRKKQNKGKTNYSFGSSSKIDLNKKDDFDSEYEKF